MKKTTAYGIFVVVGLISLFLGYKVQQVFSPESSPEIIIEMQALPASPTTSHGPPSSVSQAIYESRCAACHDTGAAGAPKLGDAAAWKPRMAKTPAVLLQHVIEGYNLMPPKGGCFECSDTDLSLAMEYMLKKAGYT
jgi:cytochrome c5